MGKRDDQRRQTDRDFERVRKAIAMQSDGWLIDALREIPHRKWMAIAKDEHVAVGILAHRAAQRIVELTASSTPETRVVCTQCGGKKTFGGVPCSACNAMGESTVLNRRSDDASHS